MRINNLKQKLSRGEPVLGIIAPYTDPSIAETFGILGMDFYMVDGEHGPISPAEAGEISRACEAANITPLARVRSIDPKLILQFLDVGIMGVMMPSVTTPEEVKRLVEAVKYPPLGERGLGPVRADEYMIGPRAQQDYVKFANEQTLVLPVLEDIKAVSNMKQMVQVPGVDVWVIGPRDLAMSMGFYDGPNHKEVQEVIDVVTGIVLEAHLFVGITAGTGDAAKAYISKGMRFIINSASTLLKSSTSAYIKGALQ